MYGVKTTSKDIRALAEQLGARKMGVEWLHYREGCNYTRVAYSQNAYGVCWELFYIKDKGEFVLI